MKKYGTLDISEKTMAVLLMGDRWWMVATDGQR